MRPISRALIMGAALFCVAGTAQAGDGIVWRRSYSQALAEAKKTHKTVVVDFYAEW